jgi:methionine-rich copper-binding protein CopC
VINADTSATRDTTISDWIWHRDSQRITARVSADFIAPSVTNRRPRRNTHSASTRAHVSISFSDRMFELTSKTVKLVAPDGRSVSTKLALTTNGKKSGAAAGATRVVLTPRRRLRARTRYKVRLSRDLRDFGGNALPASALTWSFVTKR